MLELDGSGGGGQLVRTALSLSALTGEPFRMTGIRGARPEPGLRPQHLAAVRALASITDATVSGAEKGSEAVRFEPGPIRPGSYEVDVGTAGSVTLLFDTLLPLVVELDRPLTLSGRGGTDVKWAPTLDYLRWVKLPLLRRQGIGVAVDLVERGFYPSGGGTAVLSLYPSTPKRFDLQGAGTPETNCVYSVATPDLADREVAERQASAAVEWLDDRGLVVDGQCVEYADAHSTGSAIVIALDRGPVIVGGDAVGERGRPAEAVAQVAVDRAVEPIEVGASVDVNMADQLLVFLALADGQVTVPTVTDHVETATSLLGKFGYDIEVETGGSLPIVRS